MGVVRLYQPSRPAAKRSSLTASALCPVQQRSSATGAGHERAAGSSTCQYNPPMRLSAAALHMRLAHACKRAAHQARGCKRRQSQLESCGCFVVMPAGTPVGASRGCSRQLTREASAQPCTRAEAVADSYLQEGRAEQGSEKENGEGSGGWEGSRRRAATKPSAKRRPDVRFRRKTFLGPPYRARAVFALTSSWAAAFWYACSTEPGGGCGTPPESGGTCLQG